MPLMTYSRISCPGLANSVKMPNTKVIFPCSHFAICICLKLWLRQLCTTRWCFGKWKLFFSATLRWFLGSSHSTKFGWRGDTVQACTRQWVSKPWPGVNHCSNFSQSKSFCRVWIFLYSSSAPLYLHMGTREECSLGLHVLPYIECTTIRAIAILLRCY